MIRLGSDLKIFLLVVGLLPTACAHRTGVVVDEVPTLAIEGFEYPVQRYIGRTVRVCGSLEEYEGELAVVHIPEPGEFYFHGSPAVHVLPCRAETPRLDRNSCVTGRVAARDGNLSIHPARWRIREDHTPVDKNWVVHMQCRRSSQP